MVDETQMSEFDFSRRKNYLRSLYPNIFVLIVGEQGFVILVRHEGMVSIAFGVVIARGIRHTSAVEVKRIIFGRLVRVRADNQIGAIAFVVNLDIV